MIEILKDASLLTVLSSFLSLIALHILVSIESYGSVLQYLKHTSQQQLLKHLAQSIPYLIEYTTDLRVR